MALSATMYRVVIDLSDVDRNVYEKLDLRVARHPSESLRYMVLRVLAYALSYEEGISFSHGLSHADEPAIWTHDLTGNLLTWIDIGQPSAERLHKASKAAKNVRIYTHADPAALARAAEEKKVHRRELIDVFAFDASFVDALGATMDRTTKWEVVHTDGQLYVTESGKMTDAHIQRSKLG